MLAGKGLRTLPVALTVLAVPPSLNIQLSVPAWLPLFWNLMTPFPPPLQSSKIPRSEGARFEAVPRVGVGSAAIGRTTRVEHTTPPVALTELTARPLVPQPPMIRRW